MIQYVITDSKLADVLPLDEEIVCDEIEKAAADFGLDRTQKTTLSSKAGSHHWHYKKGRRKGVLELTYWPKKSELTLEIHRNREAEWNVELIEPLAARYAELFAGKVR